MIIWTVAVLAVAIAGSALWRGVPLPELGLAYRTSVGFVAGALYVTTVMFAASAIGIRWTVAWIAMAILVPASSLFIRTSNLEPQSPEREVRGSRFERRGSRLTLAVILFFTALTAYGTLTARETCADLIYFWGTKATRFAAARAIDLPFLADPAHLLMHPDYPPLVPLLYAWGAMFAWSYWGPLLLTTVLVAMTAFVVAPFSRSGAMLMAALLAFTCAQGLAAGAADPMLVLFEVTALAALTFIGETRGGAIVASVALSAAAMTKVEGAAFVAVAIVAYAIIRRKLVRALAIAIAPAALLAAWLLYAQQHGLTSSYSHGTLQFSAATLMEVAKTASYHAYYLPWLAVLVPLTLTRRWKRAALPLVVAAGSIAYILFFYMHSGADTHLWIAVSAERVLITPLASLAVAVAVATPSE
jgi:hypothetical protein